MPVFHKLPASTRQLLFSPSYCYLHALIKCLSPWIDLRQICFIELVNKDQALPGPAALQNCTRLKDTARVFWQLQHQWEGKAAQP